MICFLADKLNRLPSEIRSMTLTDVNMMLAYYAEQDE
jgi:hypothetical protein